MNQVEKSSLPIGVKIGYGGAGGSSGLMFTLFIMFSLFFFTDVVGIDPAFAGIIMMIGTLWDAVTDPAVGIISDRIKSRWGRRRPFLFAVAVPFGVISWLLFTDFGLDPFWTRIYFIAMVILFFTAFTMEEVPHLSLSAEMSQDYDERTSLMGWRAAWSQVFTIVGAGLALVLAGYFTRVFDSQRIGWSCMAGIFGLICIPMILISWRSTRGYELFPEQTHISFKDVFSAMLKNRPFRYTVGIYTMGVAGMSLAGAVCMYFMTYNLGFSENQSSVALIVLFGCTVLWILPIAFVSSRFGKRAAWIMFVGLWALIQAVGVMFLVKPGMATLLYVLLFFASGGVVGVTFIGQSMIGDVVEVDEYKTGQRREGLYYGITTFVQKAGCAVAVGLSGMVLEYVGYVPDATQTDEALFGIKAVYGIGVALFLVASVAFAYLLPMTGEKHRALREAIKARAEGREYDASAIEDILK